MNRMKSLAGAVAIAAVAAVTVVAAPGGPGKGGRGGHHGGSHRADMMRDLDLTDAQRTEIREMSKRHREAMKPHFERQREAREKLDEALKAGNRDAAEIGELTLAVNASRKEFEASREQLRDQIAALLTPEQKVKFEKFEAENKQKREEWREKKRTERREDRKSRR